MGRIEEELIDIDESVPYTNKMRSIVSTLDDDNEIYKHKFKKWLFNIVKLKQYLPLFEKAQWADMRCVEFLDETEVRNTIGMFFIFFR